MPTKSELAIVLEELRELKDEVQGLKEKIERRGRPVRLRQPRAQKTDKNGQVAGLSIDSKESSQKRRPRQEYTTYSFRVDKQLLQQMKRLSIRDAKKMKQIMEEAMAAYLERKDLD